jgi:hypothetical protein
MLILEQVDPADAPPVESYSDVTICQTDAWLDFVEETQDAKRVVGLVLDGSTCVGRFTGLITTKFGLRLLGSPFPGWTTPYMGFNLESGVPRIEALKALDRFAFKELGCIHYEIMDRNITVEQAREAGYVHRVLVTFEIDLTRPEEELLAAMTQDCRYGIRRAQRLGVTIEEQTEESFVKEYYDQLTQVFARQGLAPTYGPDRVLALMRHLLPENRLLLLRAMTADSKCVATGIFPAYGQRMHFWGAASRRELGPLRAPEAIQWYAMRYWKARGIALSDLGGGGEYKRKYGGYQIQVPWIRRSKYPGMEFMRERARKLVARRQRIR